MEVDGAVGSPGPGARPTEVLPADLKAQTPEPKPAETPSPDAPAQPSLSKSPVAPAPILVDSLMPASTSNPATSPALSPSQASGIGPVSVEPGKHDSPVASADEAQHDMTNTAGTADGSQDVLPRQQAQQSASAVEPTMSVDTTVANGTAPTETLQNLFLTEGGQHPIPLNPDDSDPVTTQTAENMTTLTASPIGPLGIFPNPMMIPSFERLPQPSFIIGNELTTPLSDALIDPNVIPQPLSDFVPPGNLDMAAVSQDASQTLTSEPVTPAPSSAPPPTGFAKFEFEDGSFFMTTYAVELGRDMKAYKLAQQQAMEAEIKANTLQVRANGHGLERPPETPKRAVRSNGPGSVARSFVSESGGIMGEDDGHVSQFSFGKRKRKKSRKSRSDESITSQVERKNSLDMPNPLPTHAGFATEVPRTVDPNVTARLVPSAHVGDPHHVPLIPIHPANLFSDPAATGKGISRKHVKIAYNFETSRFEMNVMGRNGAFHDQQYYGPGSTVPLHDRSEIQIAGVNFSFVLPHFPNETEHEDVGSMSGRMSFSFEDGQGESIVASDVESDIDQFDDRSSHLNGFGADASDMSDDVSASAQSDSAEEDIDEEEEEEEEEEEAEEEEDEEEEVIQPVSRTKTKAKPLPPPKEPARRGRPPKNAPRAQKTTVTLKLKLGKQSKPEPSAKARVKGQKADSPTQKVSKPVAKTVSKTVSKTVPKEASKGVKESSKEPVQETATVSAKEPSREPSKDPAASKEESKADKPVRIARDEALLNGEGVNIPELPVGYIVPPRKKGPGRPPKDGIMSKREKALLVKQIKAEEHARRLGIDVSQLPRPEPRPKPAPRRNSKGEVLEGDAQDGEGKSGDAEDKKPKVPRPPRSPSPEIRIEDYTEEQLQRPQCNYVLLIHEAITNSKTGALNLQQIYSAIERRWPFFKFRTTSNGWQSSVRHNLGQHEAFRQVEKDGKGWLWGIKPGVPIERERKKKATPPPQPPPPNPALNQYAYGQYPPGAPRPPGAPPAYQYQPPRPRTFVPPTLPQATASTPQTYSSPYDAASSRPSDATNGPATASNGLPQYIPGTYLNRYAPNSTSHTNPPPSRTPPIAQGLSGAKFTPPSADLVETFRRVFIGTAQKQKDGMDLESATRIVDNAIRRVLHPEKMAGIAAENNELQVARAFETCLHRSQGPPRRVTPGEPLPAASTAPPTNVAVSAAVTAAAPPVAGANTTPGNQPNINGSSAPPVNQPMTSTATSNATATGAIGTSQTSAQRPAGPAEANLISLLTGAGARPVSPAVTAPVRPSAAQVPNELPSVTTAPTSTSMIPASAGSAATTGATTNPMPPENTMPASGPAPSSPIAPIASTETHPPPASNSSSNTTVAPVAPSTPVPPFAPKTATTPPSPTPNHATAPLPSASTATASLSVPPAALTSPAFAALKPGGLPLKVGTAATSHANGIASPLRPLVEPLTPPAQPVDNVNVAGLNGAATVAGVKRALESIQPDEEGEQAVKKAKVEV